MICFQEAPSDLKTQMDSLANFESHFEPRMKEGNEGLIVMFDKRRFELMERKSIQFKLEEESGYKKEDALKRELNRYAVGIIDILRDKVANKVFGVVCVHMPFDPSNGMNKLGILVCIFKALREITGKFFLKDIFFCGDMNFIPNSMLYSYITTGKLNLKVSDEEYSNQSIILDHSRSIDLDLLSRISLRKFNSNYLTAIPSQVQDFITALDACKVNVGHGSLITIAPGAHPHHDPMASLEALSRNFSFKSVYNTARFNFWEQTKKEAKSNQLSSFLDPNEYLSEAFPTQYAPEIKSTFDYIFQVGAGAYEVEAILEVPELRWLEKHGRSLPFGVYGSDHFSLVADFRF